MAITQIIATLPAVLNDSETFYEDIAIRNNSLVTVSFPSINTWATQANALAVEVNDKAAQVAVQAVDGGYSQTYINTNFVGVNNAQTIAGIKTFSSFPITPSTSPTTDYQVVNKKYVDDNNNKINSLTNKVTPVDADELVIADSASSFSLKKLSFSNLNARIIEQQFDKPIKRIPLFIKVSPSSIKIPTGLRLTVGSVSFKLSADYTLSLNTNLVGSSKIAGTDYYVYAKLDMTFYLSANDAITADRLIGGFHYGLTAEAEVLTGNKTEADMVQIRGINAYSIWDLKFRASASNKGMVLILGKWFDIYLCNSEHITNGTSKAGAIIAGGALTQGRLYPKIPLSFGGNGTLTYGALKWFHACEIGRSHSKQNISYQEFQTIAYGVQEQVDASSQDGGAANIQHFANLTSKWGIEQATGTQYIWGSDLTGDTAGTFTRQSVAEGRGTIYSIGNSPNAVALGGDRDGGVNAGSRCSGWNAFVWTSDGRIGCRFACDHLQHA